MSDLNTAIQLIREGRKEEARKILEPLLKTEPNNIQAWFWYVDTCSTMEKRIQVLEICLKMNPGNSQVLQALQKLSSQRAPQTSFTSSTPSPKSAVSQPVQKSSPSSYTPTSLNNAPIYTPVGSAANSQGSQDKKKNAWEEDTDGYVDTSLLSKPKPVAKTYAFYEIWITVLSMLSLDAYKDLLNDPEAGAGRAFEWMAYAGIISGLIAPFSLLANPQFTKLMSMPEVKGLIGSLSSTAILVILAFALALLLPILNIIGLAISGGIQNIVAIFMGGEGSYRSTLYAIAAYLAPITIINAGLGAIPLAGQCLISLLGIYSIILNVRALQAAHSLSIGKALGVIFLPGIVLLMFGCVIFMVVGFPHLSR